MLIGMGLFKLGVLQGDRPTTYYRRMILIALSLGAPLVVYGVVARIGINPTVGPYLGFTEQLPYRYVTFNIGCALTSFAVLGAGLLLHASNKARFAHAIECVGRMALTNYLMHSLIFVLLFHSAALLPFDQLDHDAMLLLVVGTWALQITMSMLWLRYFSQGPIETIWRKATDRIFSAV